MRRIFGWVFLLSSVSFFLAACANLKESKPLFPVREYERMIVGRLDAEYVGTDNCVAKCHKHDGITDDFRRSVHGEQIKPETRLPLVNCESCHGPGSLAIENLPDNPEENDRLNKKCDTTTFLDIMNLPPQAQSLICLKCHSAASIPALAHWNASAHALNDVSCFDCHKLHQGPQQKVSHREMAEMCYGCHPEVKAENQLFSHHALLEKKIACVDCHEVHGSTQEHLLRGITPKDTCTRCHMEKQGPFVFEHGDVTENCANCHTPHGSVNNNLLSASMPFLCLQCHAGHMINYPQNSIGEYRTGATELKKLFTNRCTDCHSQVHGTDIPAPALTGPGTLRQ
ncbi:DmsE family decaheme c-type cytochrome [Geobacter sp. DSM 9736]|uniref:DmsE family decaheme c-type cytochrome n=1 Tax=Geobacter sp. DSM 9736 TaxID=1277350 RepID=UPI001E604566|nr:DmsE family decaheme c-type cytochrome [Geobacter sp. DSM 9736]